MRPPSRAPLLRFGIHLDAIDDDSRSSQAPGLQCLTQKIVGQRRHIANGQFPNLSAADPLGFSDRGFTILEDSSSVDQERFTCRRKRDSFALLLEQLYP